MGPMVQGASSRRLLALGVLLLSAWVLSRHGVEAKLTHDDGVVVYSAQQMALGVPPYRSLFDHKAPLTTLVCALPVALAGQLGVVARLAVRLFLLAVSSGVLGLLFLLVDDLFDSRRQAVLTCAVFLGLWGYGVQAASGAFPKTLALLLALASLLATTRRGWAVAGACSALALLAWQPLGIYLLVALVVAWSHRGVDGPEARAPLHVVLGAAVPLTAVVAYFATHGALRDLADGLLLFNLTYLEPTQSLDRRIEFIGLALLSFRWMGYALLVGILALLPLYATRWRASRAEGRPPLTDRFAPLLLTLPAPFVWSLVDFQAYPDMFIFLPYGTIGFAWVLHLGILQLGAAGRNGPANGAAARAATRVHAVLIVTTVLLSAHFYAAAAPRGELDEQSRVWRDVIAGLPPDARIATVGAPHVLALTRTRNLTRYGTVWRGIERYIDDRYPGGFQGWLDTLSRADLLLVDGVHPGSWDRDRQREWFRFLTTHFERRARIDRVNVFVREEGGGDSPTGPGLPPE